jgi:Conjugal transfer protein TraD
LVELTGDDRAVLLGAFLKIADTLASENRDQITVLWRRRGSRAFRPYFYTGEQNPATQSLSAQS